MEISRLALLALQLVDLVDSGRGNEITVDQAADASEHISTLLLKKFPRELSLEPDLAAFLDDQCAGHHSGNPPGIFGGKNIGLCLVIGWILESIKILSAQKPRSR